MAQHTLQLEIPDTLNECSLQIHDASFYNTDIGVTCPILSVTLPGFTQSVEFDEAFLGDLPFMLSLNACDLQVQTEQCGTYYNPLPDGIYVIKYSVSPNDLVFVEYNHLRITEALIKWKKALCDLDRGPCEPDSKVEEDQDKLFQIKMDLEAAKAMVEVCHNPKRGMELYNYAVDQLDKFTCSSCQSAKTKY